jgi:hypothetical protein
MMAAAPHAGLHMAMASQLDAVHFYLPATAAATDAWWLSVIELVSPTLRGYCCNCYGQDAKLKAHMHICMAGM